MSSIDLKQVSLSYPVYGTSARSLKVNFMHAVTGGKLFKNKKQVTVQALHEISFHLKKGDRLGLIGHNGAGKTSLLKILAQVYAPSQGSLSVSGQINSLFNVMVGMDPGLTGYETVFLRSLLAGLSKKQIRQRLPEIEAFAGLGEFMQMPLNTYSAGMLVRLGFAIMMHVPTEILLIDEIFGAGDSAFIQKAKEKICELIEQSHILVFSSHDPQLIRQFCNQVLWLEHGKMKYFGPTEIGLNAIAKTPTEDTTVPTDFPIDESLNTETLEFLADQQ